jgi:hypothetical protein
MRARKSQQIFLLVLHAVFVEQGPQFSHEIIPAMMLLLSGDVLPDGFNIRGENDVVMKG